MAMFEFLQISWDYGKEFISYEDESWEKALRAHLTQMSDSWLETLDIFRVSNDKIVSCHEEIEAEIARRAEALKLEKLKKAEDEERALYEKLAAKFAPKE